MPARIYQIARCTLAVIMLVGACNMLLYWMNPGWFPPLHPLMRVLVDSRYLLVPKILELTGAILLFTSYRALGLTLLWPVILNIALYHTCIDARLWYVVPVLIALAALASWPERSAWAGILARPRAP